ncbi:hypothetical protein BV25DRAFT_1841635 [Artomyces pyxidatus]|uniref:Uncharacterized protein n=1 Tax=Artomyces pyxidatus TaxID=48021 RepID=A0ACB8SLY5_9AGAM|nr:hypothetical protein BV25DRAFT_1841635 [Artomyces pyxidatus]
MLFNETCCVTSEAWRHGMGKRDDRRVIESVRTALCDPDLSSLSPGIERDSGLLIYSAFIERSYHELYEIWDKKHILLMLPITLVHGIQSHEHWKDRIFIFQLGNGSPNLLKAGDSLGILVHMHEDSSGVDLPAQLLFSQCPAHMVGIHSDADALVAHLAKNLFQRLDPTTLGVWEGDIVEEPNEPVHVLVVLKDAPANLPLSLRRGQGPPSMVKWEGMAIIGGSRGSKKTEDTDGELAIERVACKGHRSPVTQLACGVSSGVSERDRRVGNTRSSLSGSWFVSTVKPLRIIGQEISQSSSVTDLKLEAPVTVRVILVNDGVGRAQLEVAAGIICDGLLYETSPRDSVASRERPGTLDGGCRSYAEVLRVEGYSLHDPVKKTLQRREDNSPTFLDGSSPHSVGQSRAGGCTPVRVCYGRAFLMRPLSTILCGVRSIPHDDDRGGRRNEKTSMLEMLVTGEPALQQPESSDRGPHSTGRESDKGRTGRKEPTHFERYHESPPVPSRSGIGKDSRTDAPVTTKSITGSRKGSPVVVSTRGYEKGPKKRRGDARWMGFALSSIVHEKAIHKSKRRVLYLRKCACATLNANEFVGGEEISDVVTEPHSHKPFDSIHTLRSTIVYTHPSTCNTTHHTDYEDEEPFTGKSVVLRSTDSDGPVPIGG